MTYILEHKRIALATILICLAGLILYFWLRPTPTEAWEIAEQEYIPSLLLSGEVIAEGSTQISSPRSGKVLACPVAKGEQVIQGQLLIQLDDSQALIDRVPMPADGRCPT